MKKRIPLLLILVLTISTSPLRAQDDTSEWKVEDVISQESASGLEFFPNGNSVAWVKRHVDKKKDAFVTDLYLTRLDVKKGDAFNGLGVSKSG